MSIKNLSITIICVMSLSACATLFGDNSDQLTIHSNEPNAKISVNGNQVGTGNAVYSLPRGNTAIITASEKGCSDMSVPTGQGIVGATFLDIFFWPTFFVDLGTGRMHKADPKDYTVTPNCEK